MKENKFNVHQFGSPQQYDHFKKYIDHFKKCNSILDVGCGKGIFLELMRSFGKTVLGIDMDSNNIAVCKKKKLPVQKTDALKYLKNCHKKYDGIFCSHIIEHFQGAEGVKLIQQCYRLLTDNGVLVIVTPNPMNLRIISNIFWLDITHVRPYPLELLKNIFTETGFELLIARADNQEKWYDIYRKMWHKLRNLLLDYDHFGRYDLLVVGRKQPKY